VEVWARKGVRTGEGVKKSINGCAQKVKVGNSRTKGAESRGPGRAKHREGLTEGAPGTTREKWASGNGMEDVCRMDKNPALSNGEMVGN